VRRRRDVCAAADV